VALGKREAPSPGLSRACGQVVGRSGEPDARSRCQLLPNLVLTLGPLKLVNVDGQDRVHVVPCHTCDRRGVEPRRDPAANRRDRKG